MTGSPRRASSTASASKDRPGSMAGGAGMARGVDGQSAVRAGGPPGREPPLRLTGELHHLLRRGPEPGRGEPVRVLVLFLRRLPGDDDEQPLALVVSEA